MIEVTITTEELVRLRGQSEVEHYVLKKLRAAGIPVRYSFGDLRLCEAWSADGNRRLGYGKLVMECTRFDEALLFHYTPPVDENVIDIEAREVNDVPKIKRISSTKGNTK
jgi:hypothetical protein